MRVFDCQIQWRMLPFTLSSKIRRRSETRFRCIGPLIVLCKEGIDRHEAIHAVASVLAEHMSDLIRRAPSQSDPNAPYYAALEKLTVESWRQTFG
jgi:hypothetical protein